jgi:hypothetical protein
VSDERRAWGWIAHLLDGGTTPWQDWREAGEPQTGQTGQPGQLGQLDQVGRYLPGAQQLELLRRINLVGRPSAELARQVLDASAAGRGRPDLELSGVGRRSSFGPDPVDPGDLPAGELVRVAASILADQLVDSGAPAEVPPGKPAWWRRGYRLVGDPEIADDLRAQLIARGRAPGGRRAVVYVCGSDLGTMLGHAWTQRAFGEGVNAWREWLRALRERRELPPRADLLAACRVWADRVGKDRVQVVLEPGTVASLVGERRPLTVPGTVPGEGGELARRVGSVLGLLVRPEERASLLSSRLRPRVDASLAGLRGGRPLVVPPAHRDWVEREAERLRHGIERAGYAVHGDLDRLLPTWPADIDPAHVGPSPDATLDLAVQVLLTEGQPDRRTA